MVGNNSSAMKARNLSAPPADPPKALAGREGVMSRVRFVFLMPTTIIGGIRPFSESISTERTLHPFAKILECRAGSRHVFEPDSRRVRDDQWRPAGYFALDHDQRNTANVGLEANMPAAAYASVNVYYGSGFSNGADAPSHLPGHAEVNNLSVGKAFSASLTVLNLTNRHLLTDNSLTFGGFHYNEPREIIGEVRYRFGY
jgi:hypothetical protein